MRRTTTRRGTWARATRSWLVAMMIGAFVLTLGAPALAAAPFTTPFLGPAGSDPGADASRCELAQCIKEVQLAVSGREADFAIVSTRPTTATVELSKRAPQRSAGGLYSYSGNDLVASAFSERETVHTVQFTALEPGATYHYLINALKSTPTGDDAQRTGAFTMPKRYVTATINSITVMDDSGARSAGDLVFTLRVNGSDPAGSPDTNGGTLRWFSGETENVGLAVRVAADESATVTLEGRSDDPTAMIALDLSADDLGLPTIRAFSLQTTVQTLSFTATGTLCISYGL